MLTDFGSAAPCPLATPGGIHASSTSLPIGLEFCVVPVGTPDYIAPEVLSLVERIVADNAESNDGSVPESIVGYTASVDWWSFGATLFEMCVGLPPFWADTIAKTYKCIMDTLQGGSVTFPPNINSDLRDLIQRYKEKSFMNLGPCSLFELSLLVPSQARLGSHGSAEIWSHPFFKQGKGVEAAGEHMGNVPRSIPRSEFPI